MIETLVVLDALFLLFCASIYLGTGWSLVLFSFPIAPRLTPETYAVPFVEPVTHATRWLTWLTIAMLAAAIPLVIAEWGTGYVWVPIVYLAAVILATALTQRFIFPYNQEMRSGITDPRRLQTILGKWMRLNRIRTALWTVEWLVMAAYFGFRAA